MDSKITVTKIGIRELVRNITKVKAAVARGESFEVHDRAVPVFTITPTQTAKQSKYTTDDLRTFRVPTSEMTLSAQVDAMLYSGKK